MGDGVVQDDGDAADHASAPLATPAFGECRWHPAQAPLLRTALASSFAKYTDAVLHPTSRAPRRRLETRPHFPVAQQASALRRCHHARAGTDAGLRPLADLVRTDLKAHGVDWIALDTISRMVSVEDNSTVAMLMSLLVTQAIEIGRHLHTAAPRHEGGADDGRDRRSVGTRRNVRRQLARDKLGLAPLPTKTVKRKPRFERLSQRCSSLGFSIAENMVVILKQDAKPHCRAKRHERGHPYRSAHRRLRRGATDTK